MKLVRSGGSRKRKLVVILAALLAAYLVVAPWRLTIGDAFTPLGRWRGTGELVAADGTPYGLSLAFHYAPPHNHCTASCNRFDEVRGTAMLCAPDGGTYQFTVIGHMHALLRTDGTSPRFQLSAPAGETRWTGFELDGVWHGGTLSLDDRDSFANAFGPDGKPYGATAHLVREGTATVALTAGGDAAFAAICTRVANSAP